MYEMAVTPNWASDEYKAALDVAHMAPDGRWKMYLSVALSSIVALIACIGVCLYCFRKKSGEDEEEDTGVGYVRAPSAGGNGKYGPIGFSTTRPQTEFESPLTSPGDSPGRGQKSVRYGVHPMSSYTQGMNIQPLEMGSQQSLTFSSSSPLPPEPEPPSPLDGGDLGTIYFSISYDMYDLVLKLSISKATGLPAKDITGTSDPFVKVALLPDKKHKLETRVKRKNLNPIWNEIFTFEGFPHQKLLQRTLYLQVLDYDRFSRNDPIGEVELPLADITLQKEPVPFVKRLRPCKRSPDYLGDLLISMSYNATTSRITVIVMKCTNLKVMDITGACDPYVKIYLVYAGKRIDKKKTNTLRRTLNPVWNESFDFDVPIDKIRDISFVFTVMDFDRILANEAIGQVVIGYRTHGSSLRHWTDMMNNPRKPVAMWHKIIKY